MGNQEKSDGYYGIDPSKKFHLTRPSPLDNLLKLYGLENIAKEFARINPDGSKGVKLRKSYRNHIQDLSGRHQVSAPRQIPMELLDPSIGQSRDIIKELDSKLVSQAMTFDRTPANGIPGFRASDLAISDRQTLMRGDDMSENDDVASSSKKNKRRSKGQSGSDLKRQHT